MGGAIGEAGVVANDAPPLLVPVGVPGTFAGNGGGPVREMFVGVVASPLPLVLSSFGVLRKPAAPPRAHLSPLDAPTPTPLVSPLTAVGDVAEIVVRLGGARLAGAVIVVPVLDDGAVDVAPTVDVPYGGNGGGRPVADRLGVRMAANTAVMNLFDSANDSSFL